MKAYPEFWGEEAVLFIGEDPTDTGRRKSKLLYMVGWMVKPHGHYSRIFTNTKMSIHLCRERDRLISMNLHAPVRFGMGNTS